MRVLHINSSDLDGGAARASYRLHRALLDKIDSKMLVQSKVSDDYTVIGPSSKFQKGIAKIRPTLDSLPVRFYKNREKKIFSPSWLGLSGIIKKINKINPDIVHLHWICGGMMKIEDIARIKVPIVWSLHDMWAFSSGSHYCSNESYKNSDGSCAELGTKRRNNLGTRVFKRKQRAYSHINSMTIIGLSRWLNECSKSSHLLKNKKHINLPNPIDTNTFKVIDNNIAREIWNLPKDKKLVLFGAMTSTGDKRKGFRELSSALNLVSKENIEFVVFGSGCPKNPPSFGFKTHYLGNLSDDASLVSLYNAVDVMVVPSLQENLSNAIMESLSCGTPVVGFSIGGNSDMIEHKQNGYLAQPFESKDLALGIEWVLDNKNYDELCIRARNKVLNEFDSKFVADRYIELYREILL